MELTDPSAGWMKTTFHLCPSPVPLTCASDLALQLVCQHEVATSVPHTERHRAGMRLLGGIARHYPEGRPQLQELGLIPVLLQALRGRPGDKGCIVILSDLSYSQEVSATSHVMSPSL